MKQLTRIGALAGIAAALATTTVQAEEATVRVSGGWAVYPLMVVWADKYADVRDDVEIKVAGGGTGKGVSDVLNGQVDIGMMGRDPHEKEIEQGLFPTAVAKDSVVGTIHKDNPVFDEIQAQGLSEGDFEAIFTKKITHWGEVVGKDLDNDKIVVYGRSDASGAAKTWYKFFSKASQGEFQNIADANFNGDQPLAAAVGKEPNAIGFNNLNYAYNIETGDFAGNVRPIPLDLNDNNVVDPEESFYQDRRTFLDAVAEGRYPSPPARQVYLAGKGPYTGEVKKFVLWTLTEGQKYVGENGYVQLTNKTIDAQRRYVEGDIEATDR
ncbi:MULTISPECIES: substrate-binding domain-containing protein [Halomonas]|uniref:Phosphate transport system substrate-binding protein n=1 Tax=Halomonas ventosae TaxID=229007 RepID=A0A4R6HNN3_9GAMM|nr:substrate-binding domain-containing protein [Halomonas ventosae]TDO09921.1 phosphate transport system substrate-binding protein [Halomonas ventosae]